MRCAKNWRNRLRRKRKRSSNRRRQRVPLWKLNRAASPARSVVACWDDRFNGKKNATASQRHGEDEREEANDFFCSFPQFLCASVAVSFRRRSAEVVGLSGLRALEVR